MKRAIIILAASLLVMKGALPARAEAPAEPAPNASFGVAGSFNGYNAWERKKGSSHSVYSFTPGYGGSLVFEKMFNNILGIQSGLWFNRIGADITMKQPVNMLVFDPTSLVPMKLTIRGWSITFPLSLLVSLNASFFSLNILAGIQYTHIVQNEVELSGTASAYRKRLDLLPYFSQPQFGFNAGIIFKFRITRYIDLFTGGTGKLYVTELIRENDDVALLFDLGAVAGILFRTNLFPIPGDGK
jgi:hypothetical protein